MKFRFSIYSIFVLAIALLAGCQEFDNNVPGDEQGGLIDVTESSFNFPPTNDALTAEFTVNYKVYQGVGMQTVTVNVYKQYLGSLGSSDKQLMRALDVSGSSLTDWFSFSFTYDDLISGLTIDGDPLPTVPFSYAVADQWVLTYEVELSDGTTLQQSNTRNTTVSVSGRFAGTYVVTESAYYRIGVESGLSDWTGCTRVIASLAPGVYIQRTGLGPFSFTGCASDIYGISGCPDFQQWYVMNVDEATGAITFPREYTFAGTFADAFGITNWDCGDDGIFEAGQEEITFPLSGLGDEFQDCERNPASFTNVPCANRNVAIPNNVTGKDTIKVTYGYLVTSSADPINNGVREFLETLVRQ